MNVIDSEMQNDNDFIFGDKSLFINRLRSRFIKDIYYFFGKLNFESIV
jgi:hypothetical protein